MLHLIWNASIRTRGFLRHYMPTNRLLGFLGRRDRLKWGLLAMLLAVPYLLAASTCAQIVADGGPGWVNLLVILFIWNAFKFIVNGPASVVLLIKVRAHEAVEQRRMHLVRG